MQRNRRFIAGTTLAALATLVPIMTSALPAQAAGTWAAEAQTSSSHDAAWWTATLTSSSANGFRGPILVPASQSAPFDQPVISAESRYAGSSLGNAQDEYEIRLGPSPDNLTDILLYGARGRSIFDQRAQSCDAASTYCVANVYGQPDAPLNIEWFSALTVHGQPAIASHVNCCAGGGWAVAWYDPAADISYDIDVFGDLDIWQHYEVDPSNVLYAEMLAARAEALVPVQRQAIAGATYNGVRANLLGFERPARLTPLPKVGLEYLTVELRLDNLTDRPVDFTYVRFKLEMADNTRWQTQPSWREPELGSGQILPQSSVRGWVTFAVPIGVPARQLLWEATSSQTLTIPLT